MNDNDLMLAVLSLEAYEPTPVNIGSATLLSSTYSFTNPINLSDGFSAVAYQLGDQTVIAYRGSDGWSDVNDDWGTIIGSQTTQAEDAANFYKSVVGSTAFPFSSVNDIVFTGHSLGGAHGRAAARRRSDAGVEYHLSQRQRLMSLWLAHDTVRHL